MTVQTVIDFARTLASTDSNGITDADGISMLNDAVFEAQKTLISKREDLFAQESTRDITAAMIEGGATPGKFLFPNDMWFLKNIWVNLEDPSNANGWQEAQQIDAANLNQPLDWIRENQPKNQPLFDYRGDWGEIFPTPDETLTTAMRIIYFLNPTSYTAVGNSIVFPFSMNPRMLAYKIAATYMKSLEKSNYQVFEADYNRLLDDMMGVLEGGEQKPIQTTSSYPSGFEF